MGYEDFADCPHAFTAGTRYDDEHEGHKERYVRHEFEQQLSSVREPVRDTPSLVKVKRAAAFSAARFFIADGVAYPLQFAPVGGARVKN